MKNKTYAETMIFQRNKGLLVSAICGRSPIGKIAKTIKTEVDKKKRYKQHLTSEDVEKILKEVYIESIEDFESNPEIFQERKDRFVELKNELKSLGL